jgi:hypothetical protein
VAREEWQVALKTSGQGRVESGVKNKWTGKSGKWLEIALKI